MVWSIDRLGRSTSMICDALAELQSADVALYADKQGTDATTRHGRAMLQMAAVFGELEHAISRDRVGTVIRVKREIW
jgi:DNA invertase Pin-like site-specific DNA recombinase